jgi:hypothetical protein
MVKEKSIMKTPWIEWEVFRYEVFKPDDDIFIPKVNSTLMLCSWFHVKFYFARPEFRSRASSLGDDRTWRWRCASKLEKQNWSYFISLCFYMNVNAIMLKSLSRRYPLEQLSSSHYNQDTGSVLMNLFQNYIFYSPILSHWNIESCCFIVF